MARRTVLRRKDVIISSALVVLDITAVVLFQLLLISPVTSRADQGRVRLDGAVKELEENNKKRRTLQDVTAQNRKLASQLAVFDKRIPKKSEGVVLFAEVLKVAAQLSLKIVNTQPMEPVPVGQGFIRLPYEISIQGGFADVGRFISVLETHANFFIEVAKADVTGSADGTVLAKMSLNLYVADAQPGAAPKPASADKADANQKR